MVNKPSKTISASATLIDNIPKTVLLGTVFTCGLITNDISDSLVCVTYDWDDRESKPQGVLNISWIVTEDVFNILY